MHSRTKVFADLFLFGKMLVGIDMVNAETMITLAARTIAEFKIGMIGIRSAANLASAGVWLCFLLVLNTVDLTLEVHSAFFSASAVTEISEQSVAAEQKEVENGDQGEKAERKWRLNYCHDKIQRID